MDVGAIDRSATRRGGGLRGASPAAKLLALGLVLTAVLVSWNLVVLASVAVMLVAAVVWGRIDLKLALSLAAYPAMFAVVFAFASAPDAGIGAVIVAKAVTAALGAVTVVLSTPYPQIFAPVQRITPGIVGDALLMTYRSLFILLEKFGDLQRAARLRAGLRGRHPLRAARTTASAIGSLLLYSIDLAQRDYDIMRLRGYSGRLHVTPLRSQRPLFDVIVVTASALAMTASVLWRSAAERLNPYSWLVAIPALAALALAFLLSRKEVA